MSSWKLGRSGAAVVLFVALVVGPQMLMGADYPDPQEGDFQIQDFEFASGEVLPELNLHYTTVGQPRRDASGTVENAVLIMHGTTGYGAGFLSERFAGGLFGPGQLLDAERYYIILTDAIGHGKSSRPSDGLHMKFPKYNYDDMVRAQYRLLTEHLGVDHLRLVMGTSMGGMHTWVWGYTYPDFMDALMPLASLPVEIAGRNRMQRKMIIDSDPQRSRVERRGIRRTATRPDLGHSPPDLHGQQPAAMAEGGADPGRSGSVFGSEDPALCRWPGCQRPDLPVRFLAGLRSITASGGDRRSSRGHQLGR